MSIFMCKYALFLQAGHKLFLCGHLYVYVFVRMCACSCMCVCVCPVTSGIMWFNMDPIWLVKQVLQLLYDPTIEEHCRNQASKSKLMLWKPWIHFNSHLTQLYISNKTERFSYKDGCAMHGCMHIEMFKRRAGLGYR